MVSPVRDAVTTLVRRSSLNAPDLSADGAVQRYELRELLGRGGMGEVFAAWDHELQRHVAIKVLRDADSDPRLVRRLLREARVSAGLSHPAIVRVYDTGVQPDGRPFLVMEHVDGVPLNAVARPVAPQVVAQWMAPVCDALHEAHQAGIVHRDIKPPNLLLQSSHAQTRVRVLDFGVAHVQSAEATLSRDTRFVGTALYSAPEQAEAGDIGPATDIYSLGVVLFELLTGELPFAASTASATLYLHVHRPAPDVRSLAPAVPDTLAALVGRCLNKRPAERPASARDVADELRAWLGEPPGELTPTRVARVDVTVALDETLAHTGETLESLPASVNADPWLLERVYPVPGRWVGSPRSRTVVVALALLMAAGTVVGSRLWSFGMAGETAPGTIDSALPTLAADQPSSPLAHPDRAASESPPPSPPGQPSADDPVYKASSAARSDAGVVAAAVHRLALQTAQTRASERPHRRSAPPRTGAPSNPVAALPAVAPQVHALRSELRALQQSNEPSRPPTDELREELRRLRGVTP